MRVKTLVGRKTAALAFTAVVAIGLTGCFPNTGAPPTEPFQKQLFNALNYDRAMAGLPPLTWSPKLANNAGTWAWQMMRANRLYHQNLGALIYTADYNGFRTLGENIIVGPGSMSANSIEGAWRSSPPHWANIASRAFNIVGIGYVRGPDGRIWAVQEFGGI